MESGFVRGQKNYVIIMKMHDAAENRKRCRDDLDGYQSGSFEVAKERDLEELGGRPLPSSTALRGNKQK